MFQPNTLCPIAGCPCSPADSWPTASQDVLDWNTEISCNFLSKVRFPKGVKTETETILCIVLSFKSIAFVSTKEKQSQILIGKWNKKTKEQSICSNNEVSASTMQIQ